MGFGAFFASIVILPLWLQTNMGYTATWAGYATGIMGILAVLCAPWSARPSRRVDARLIISLGILWLAASWCGGWASTPDVTFLQMALPTLLTGPAMVMFFVPVTGLAMASVDPDEQANAAGLSNFMRTLAGAFATSLVQTGWSNAARHNQTELAGAMHNGQATLDAMVAQGTPHDTAVTMLSGLVESQSVMLATLNMFAVIAICFVFAAAIIWLAPKPQGTDRHQRRSLTDFMEKKMKIETYLAPQERRHRGHRHLLAILQVSSKLMMRNKLPRLIVTDGGEPVGLVSERDLVNALADKGPAAAEHSGPRDHGPVPAVSRNESLKRAMALMTGSDCDTCLCSKTAIWSASSAWTI